MPIDPRTLKGYHGPGGGKRQPCTSCGYDLAGLPADGVCPECGVGFGRMAEVAPAAPPDKAGGAAPGGRGGAGAGARGAGDAKRMPVSAPPESPRRLPQADGRYAEGAACPQCGYGLGGLKVGSACPECKHRVEPLASEPAAGGRTSGCLACGYDLAGLPPGSICPECGTPDGSPAASVRGTGVRAHRHNHSLLMDLPVQALKNLRSRVRLLCFAWMGWMVAWLGVWLASLAVIWLGFSRDAIAVALLLAGGTGVVTAVTQWWAVGGKQARGVGGFLGESPRRRTRAMLAPLVWTFLAVTIGVSLALGGGASPAGYMVQLFSYAVAVAAGVALAAVLPVHAELARLLQDDHACNRLTGLTWGVLLAVLFGCFMVMMSLYTSTISAFAFGRQIIFTIITVIAPTLWFGALIDVARGFSWAVDNRQSQLDREARWVSRSTERGQAERQRDARAFGRPGQ
ncbi:MAG: hypothetical protein LW650_00755 [Planctomycetaceae bacterium]|nr:hypothetical protein [Phycisphaerales bacterium]MCE2652068.1 hypothetical protein [Planctomycetaceae bacterium]